MIELMILGQLWGIRKNTAVLAREDDTDIEAGVLTFGFLMSILLWPVLLAWPLLKMGVPKWLAFLIVVLFGAVALLVLTFFYFTVGLVTALIGLTVLIVKYA